MGYIGGHGVQFSKKKNERDLAENERDLAELDKHLAVVLRAWSVPRPFHPGPFLEPSCQSWSVPRPFLDRSWSRPGPFLRRVLDDPSPAGASPPPSVCRLRPAAAAAAAPEGGEAGAAAPPHGASGPVEGGEGGVWTASLHAPARCEQTEHLLEARVFEALLGEPLPTDGEGEGEGEGGGGGGGGALLQRRCTAQ